MKYLAIGSLFVNNINFADGTQIKGIMGGGGFFAYTGILQYTSDCAFVAGTGTDFEKWFGEYYDRNHLSRAGLVPYDDLTTNANMQYEPDGQWHEVFVHGPIYEKQEAFYHKLLDRVEELAPTGVKGIYLCVSVHSKDLWKRIAHIREKYGIKIMSELSTVECVAELLDKTKEVIINNTDFYSLNKPESFTLFGVDTVEDAIKEIQELGKPCFYRVGEAGAYVVTEDEAVYAKGLDFSTDKDKVDPTGCGNCSTGASMWALCEGYSLREVGYLSNVAAAYNALQSGPYPDYSEEARQRAFSKVKEIVEDQINY